MKCITCGNYASAHYEEGYIVMENQDPFPAREVTYTGNAQEARNKGLDVVGETQIKVIVCGCNEGVGRAPNETPQI